MCGIAGYKGQGEINFLQRANDLQRHRGPDDSGIKVIGDVGLAHRRLAIIDLSPAGHQPMSNEDQTVWIVFNGEIYNFSALKKGLQAQHQFVGHSDTEVLVHLYEELGEGIFTVIEGMFSLAIYDSKQDKLILARDRYGKKPLYYSMSGETLYFSSELKGLIDCPAIAKDLDMVAIENYFFYDYIPTPATPFAKIKKLPAGHYGVYQQGSLQLQQYYKLDFSPIDIDFVSASQQMEALIEKAVTDRLVADVPVGVLLSGGIDSSTIAYFAAQHSQQKIKTFSIGFADSSFDESSYAKLVADKLGTDHYEQILEPQKLIDVIDDVINLLDEPMADPSIIPTYLLSQMVGSQVKVALGGDGGDEILAGYDTFLAERHFQRWAKYLPSVVKPVLQKISFLIPATHGNMSLNFKLQRFINGIGVYQKYRNEIFMQSWGDIDRRQLMNSQGDNNVLAAVDNILREYPTGDWVNQLALKFTRGYLLDDILVKVDRASMANSLEVRAPLLDRAVVDFANHLPVDYKLHGANTKYILKKIMRGKLPDEIIDRPKKGFGMPISRWINHELKDLFDQTLSREAIEAIGFLDYNTVARVMAEHRSGQVDRRKEIWSLFIFVSWFNKWVKNN